MQSELLERIAQLKRQRGALILAHYYTDDDVQRCADFVGDSLALAQKAAKTDAKVIVFAGVRFMAETAKVLCPDRMVLMPEPEAGCSLADSCNATDFARFKAQYPDHKVVSYVNTSVEVKALTDICCTSSNAVRVIESLPQTEKIIFAPDRNLGDYIKRTTGRNDIVLWDGACHVHEQFSVEKILELKRQHPTSPVLAHPECKRAVLMIADFVGSTAAILDYCADHGDSYIVVTESGIMFEMRQRYPSKEFIAAPPVDSTCGCNNCSYMKMITLQKIYDALSNLSPEVVLDEEVRRKAERSIRAMLEL